jgi:ribosomal protein L1
MFIDDQQGQIITTVVIEGEAVQQLRSKCQLAFQPSIQRSRQQVQERESKQQVRDDLALPVNTDRFSIVAA